MINNYYEYLLESFLRTSDRLKELLKGIEDPVSSDILSLIDTDIKTQYNALDYLDKENDKLSFLSDSQFNNKLKNVSNYKELISNNNNSSGVGRIVKKILKDNGIEKTDREIENFVNKFKSSLNKGEQIKIVKGEDIRYWYLETNYYGNNVGTLWNSCMRYERCQPFLDIYVENDNVSLLIMTKENKLVARALVWDKIEGGGKYLDRIYYTSDQYQTQMLDWAKKNIDDLKGTHSEGSKVVVSLTKYKFDKYPYMDTFRYSDDSGVFAKMQHDLDQVKWVYSSTTGKRDQYVEEDEDEDTVYSDIHGYSIHNDDAWYSDYYSDYLDIYNDDVTWCEVDQEYYLLDDCVRDINDNFILEKDAVECIGKKGKVYVHVDSGDFYEYDEETYHIDYGVETVTYETVPPEKAIKLVVAYLDGVSENIIKLIDVYGGPTNVDEKMCDYLDLTYSSDHEKYIGINEYPEWSIEDDKIRDGLMLLVDLKTEGTLDNEGFEYIFNQLTSALDSYIKNKHTDDNEILGLSKDEITKVWTSLIENNWDKITKKYSLESLIYELFPAYHFKTKDIINLSSKDPDIPKEIIKNFFNADYLDKYIKKKLGFAKPSRFSWGLGGLLHWKIFPLVFKIYKENYHYQKTGLFPLKEKEYLDTVFKLHLVKYYSSKI